MWEALEAKLEAISKMCIFMYVGEFDPYMWHDEMEGEAESTFVRLFDGFEEAQKGCGGK